MAVHPLASRLRLTPVLCLGALAVVVAFATPARAAHKARLSADLADHLAAGSQTIDVIVHGDRAAVDALARRYNVVVRKYLRSGAVLRVTAGQLAALAEDDSQDHLSADIRLFSSGDVTAETVAADQVWAGTGALRALNGAGISVAVIDSGVDYGHHALRGRVVATRDFLGGDGSDKYGHGTHVAAMIAGRPGLLADTRDYRGIAYGANIVNLRVLDERGAGTASDVIEAIDWAVENRKAYNIRVINLSLGAPVLQPYRDDPLCEAVERAVSAGIVVVTAAGNFGQTRDGSKLIYGGITSPGNDPNVITVGAIDAQGTPQRSDDTLARYSSKGPTMYDLVLKPDLVAPGSHIVSAEAANSYLATTYSQRHVAGNGADAYIQLSGTSMAASVVSGTVALLLQERPKLSPREAKAVLQLTASFMPAVGLAGAGTGSVNALAAAVLVDSGHLALSSEVAGEVVHPSRVAYIQTPSKLTTSSFKKLVPARGRRHDALAGGSTTARARTIVWGAETIVWGSDTIVWGSDDTIIWGSDDTIIWGSDDTIIWGSDDTIIWGSDDTIVWGSNTIVWGSDDTIVWGSDDTIVWGSCAGLLAE